jgi:translation initiation factor IF-3
LIIAQNNRPNRSFGPKNKKDAQHRINEYITAQVVRVVGDNLEPQIVSLRDALAIADERGVDLVEISP